MKKLLMSWMMICLLLLPSTAFSFSFNASDLKYTASGELNAIYLSQTVEIVSFGRGMGRCSGTVIHEDLDNHYVLTAKHCVDVTEEMYVEDIKVSHIITSIEDDLAVLALDGKIDKKSVAKMAYIDANIDEVVHHVAYPNGIIYKASGKITRENNDWQFVNFKSIGGCSGGGVFNNRGSLIGVLWGGYPMAPKDAPIKSIIEPIEDVRMFLRTAFPKAL